MNDPLMPGTLAALMQAGSAMAGTVLASRGVRGVFLSGTGRVGGAERFAGPATTVRFLPTREDLTNETYLCDPSVPAASCAAGVLATTSTSRMSG